jgi:hypothetical protein
VRWIDGWWWWWGLLGERKRKRKNEWRGDARLFFERETLHPSIHPSDEKHTLFVF